MPRPKGSKIFSCPKCGERVVALPGEYGTCNSCGTRTKLTKVLMSTQGPISRGSNKVPQKVEVLKGRKPVTPTKEVEAPKKRGRKPAAPVGTPQVEAPKKRGRKPAVTVAQPEPPKKRGRKPAEPAPQAELPKKRGRKPAVAVTQQPEPPKKRGRKPGSKNVVRETEMTPVRNRIMPPQRAR